MKPRLFLLPFICLTLLALCTTRTKGQNLVTFDELHETGSGSEVPSSYHGLVWSSIFVNNAVLATNLFAGWHPNLTNGLTGDYYGMVSSSNVADLYGSNAYGIANSEIDSLGTNFNFISAYLTGFWNSNLNIEVQGFNGLILAYDTTVVVNATSPTLFTFNYLDINRLYFNSYGGQPAFGVAGGDYVSVMDNFTFEFIPEPSSLLLTGIATAALLAFCKRRRA